MFAALVAAVPAAAAIPHISASNTAAVPSGAANPDAPAAAAVIPASEFQENPLKGRRVRDNRALRSSSKVSFTMYHLAKHLTSFLGHGGQVLNMEC